MKPNPKLFTDQAATPNREHACEPANGSAAPFSTLVDSQVRLHHSKIPVANVGLASLNAQVRRLYRWAKCLRFISCDNSPLAG